MTSKTKTIRFPNEVLDQVEKKAKEEKRTFSNMVISILCDYFKKK